MSNRGGSGERYPKQSRVWNSPKDSGGEPGARKQREEEEEAVGRCSSEKPKHLQAGSARIYPSTALLHLHPSLLCSALLLNAHECTAI